MFYKYAIILIKSRSIKGKRVSKETQVHEFHFHLKINPHSHFHVTCALSEDFEIFDNFDHIFTTLWSLCRPLKEVMTPLDQQFEFKIQVYDHLNTAKHKNGIYNFFGLHL